MRGASVEKQKVTQKIIRCEYFDNWLIKIVNILLSKWAK